MQTDAIGFLNDIERGFDTSSLLYHGVSYWPLCRLRLWSKFLESRLKEGRTGDAISNAGPTWSDVGRVNAQLAGPAALGLVAANPEIAETFKNSGALTPDTLFFVRPEEHNERVNGAVFAKILDSVFETAAAQGPAAKLELSDPRTLNFTRTIPSLFIHLGLTGRDVKFDPAGELENFHELSAFLASIPAAMALDHAAFLTDMGKIFYFARIFEKLLRLMKPRLFVHSVYYHPVGMAWMLACRWAGVPSVDVQHGRLGPIHGLYTQMTAAPPDGYHLMPDTIWCWGEQTKHDIEVDLNPACRRHRGIIGGNPWLYRWRHGSGNPDDLATAQNFQHRFSERPKILVSFQPIALVPEVLLQAMKQSPPEWIWLLRLHPLRRHNAAELHAVLARHGLTNYELDMATTLPLFWLLDQAAFHVTDFSSVAVEAAAYGVRTAVITQTGAEIFHKLIERGYCRLTLTAEELLAATADAIASPKQSGDPSFFDLSEGVVERALTALKREHRTTAVKE